MKSPSRDSVLKHASETAAENIPTNCDPQNTVLLNRDRDRFMEILNDERAAPSEALLRAAQKYKQEVG